MAEVSVVGAGMIPFGKYPDRSLVDLGAEAAFLAFKDSGLNPKEVDIAYFANGFGGRLFGDFTIGQNVLWQVGINRIPVVNVEMHALQAPPLFIWLTTQWRPNRSK